MSKKLTLTVDPRLTNPTKLHAILRTNPPLSTAHKRHCWMLRDVAMCLYEQRVYGIVGNPEAVIYRVINRYYID